MLFPDPGLRGLTPRQNFEEMIKADGHPDRFVDQYDFMGFAFGPYILESSPPAMGEPDKQDSWGIWRSFPEGQPGAYPVHTPDKIVCKDFEEWQDYVKAPSLKYPEEMWQPFIAEMEKVPRDQVFCSAFMAPGLFEDLHYLGSMVEALSAFYEYPDELKELIKYLLDWEIEMCDGLCSHLHPDMLLHHDDWGSRTSTFLSPDMFAEFFLEPYQTLYGRYKENGVKYVVHHSDSFGATIVPYMIEMGIDVWQGVMTSNNIPELLEKYKGQIAFMGGLDGADIEFPDWSDQMVDEMVRPLCKECGPHGFIPCITQGLPMSTYDGLYDSITRSINECSHEMKEFFE